MNTKIEVSVILPTYNEAENIGATLAAIAAVLTAEHVTFELIVVDDDSPDLTWKVASEIAETQKNIRVVHRLHRTGLSSAVLDGMASSRGAHLVVMDADLQHDPKALPAFLQAFKAARADIVVGSRAKAYGGSAADFKWYRCLVSGFATFLSKRILSKPISDPMSGYFALTKQTYLDLAPQIVPRGYKILLEFLARAKRHRVVEVGYEFLPRQHGVSKLGPGHALDLVVALYDLKWGRFVSTEFIKYSIVGLSGVGIRLGVAEGLSQVTRFSQDLILVMAFLLSVVSNFYWNNCWSFKRHRLHGVALVRGFSFFLAISVAGLMIMNSLQNSVLTQTLFEDWVASALALTMTTIWNFTLNKNITWKLG